MNYKKKFLFLIIRLLMIGFTSNYVMATPFTFTPVDVTGKLLEFKNPVRIAGVGINDGNGSASVGAKYKYTNVTTVNGVQVDAIVEITGKTSNATVTTFDQPNPNGAAYTTTFGLTVPEATLFAPEITVIGTGYVDFTISFQGIAGNPLTLENFYNNSIDIDGPEFVEYGGFQSYQMCSSHCTTTNNPTGAYVNTTDLIATTGAGGNGTQKRFTQKTNNNTYNGLVLNDAGRVQTVFDSVTNLKITMGQTNGSGVRLYGSVFVNQQYVVNPPAIVLAPTVNPLTTTNTKPSITGSVGGPVTTANTSIGSPVTGTQTFSVAVNNVTYNKPNSNLTFSADGLTWMLKIPTALTAGVTYEVTAIRDGLSDQTSNELVIVPICIAPAILNADGTICVTPTVNTVTLCHSDDGQSYTKFLINNTGANGHESHPYDVLADANGACPTPVPVTCILPAVRDSSTNTCVTPAPNTCPTLENLSATIPSYALSDNGNKVTICHNTSSATNPFNLITISINALSPHLNNHGDFFTKSGVCPTDAVPCPPVICTFPQIINAVGDGCVLLNPPTVDSQTTTNTMPTITGTVGSVGLSAGEPFSVAVNNVTYNKGNANLAITSTNWMLNISTPLAVGTYNVDALRNNTLPDNTSGELVIKLSCTAPQQLNFAGDYCISAPTVFSQSVADTTPTIMGTIGSGSLGAPALGANEAFKMVVNSVIYNKGDAALSINGATWTLTIPDGNALIASTSYPVTATRDGTLSGSGTVTITGLPTVESQSTTNKTPVIKGTVGDTPLNTTDTFTVTVNAKTYSKTDSSLVINGLNWTLTIPAANKIPAGTYNVEAVHNGTLKDNTTGELIINALSPPSVNAKETFDTTPTITGKIGDVALATGEVFTVNLNNQIYTAGDSHLIVTTLDWTLTIPKGKEIAAGTYNVEAARDDLKDTTTNELKIKPCPLPSVVNETADTCSIPVPTVVAQTITSSVPVSPVITGTVGDVVLGTPETFSVTVETTPPQIYNKGDNALVINALNWTLTIPAAKAISAGTYEVEAARNTTAKDITHNELVINLVCEIGQTNINNTCVSNTLLPTVNFLSTDDTTPTLTGTVGNAVLSATEDFTVEVNGVIYDKSQIIFSGAIWKITIPLANALSVGNYDVVAARNTTLKDTTRGELTIIECIETKKINADGDCVAQSVVPTVNALNAPITASSITVTGTVGDSVLANNDVFTVKVSNAAHSKIAGNLTVTGVNWAFALTERYEGTYDVDAVRNGQADLTSGELVITDNIDICNAGKSQSIKHSEWDGSKESKTYYLGKCALPECSAEITTECTPALPKSPKELAQALPNEPLSVTNQYVPVYELVYCDDGGVKSSSPATNVTIKRARIVNASTENGTIDLTGMPTKVKYGIKAPGMGTMDINNATINEGKATGATLTGVTLNNVYIDTVNDYIDANGNLVAGNTTFIKVMGGKTKPTTLKEDGTITDGTIISGMITAGQDSAGNPVRGSITTGLYNADINNADSVLTEGRRTQGTIVNATIEDAQTTTVNGVTVVDAGTITSGQMDLVAATASTFGTVINATLSGTEISNTNHCFSSGTVGTHGQLNWKEVVK